MEMMVPSEAPAGLAPLQRAAVSGIVSWEARWPTIEQARELVSKELGSCEGMTDGEVLHAAHVPRPELAGLPVKPEHVPDFKISGEKGEKHNLVVTVGLADIVKNIGFGLSAVTGFKSIAVGSSSTPVATGDTALTTELTTNGWARSAAAVTSDTTTLAGDTLKLVQAFTLTGTPGTVEEIGIFNNSTSGGDMLTHALTGTITLPAGPVVTFTYKVVFASA